MTFATSDGRTIRVSNDIVRALVGFKTGYNVTLHCAPQYTFEIDADSGDNAHKAALDLWTKEHARPILTGATIQKR